jgi:hypothetical protein
MDRGGVDDREFLERVVHEIPGWLEDYTAIRSMDLLRYQEESGLSDAILEIGVFAGRYFSILLRSAMKQRSTIVGLDTFQYMERNRVQDHLRAVDASSYDKLKFLTGASTNWQASELRSVLGGSARFISIDGSHEKSDVFWDLRLAEEIVSREGILAVDDFLNPITLGVNQAVNFFFQQPRNLVPWAYVANKLFFSRATWATRYKDHLELIVTEDQKENRSLTFRENLAKGRNLVEVELFGHLVLIIP